MVKNIIIFAVVAALLIIGGFGFWYFKKAGNEQDFVDIFFNFDFPEFEDLPFVKNGDNGEGGDILSDTDISAPLFRQISDTPTVGAIFLNKNGGATTTDIRFLERSSGYVYETNIETMKKSRITNTTIPRVYETIFGKMGENSILRYLDEDNQTIKTFIGNIIESTNEEDGSMEGEFMQDNIISIISSPDKERIFYLYKKGDNAAGIVADMDGKNKKNVFEFPFFEWLPKWQESGIYLSTKPSYNTKGYVYKLNTRDGTLQKIIGGINGLVALSDNSGEKIFYSKSEEGSVKSYIYNVANKKSEPAPFDTLPDKCVWGKEDIAIYCAVPIYLEKENYPDAWYQGKVFFDDMLWVLYTDTNTIDVVGDPFEKIGEQMDMINLVLSDDKKYLLFTNKKDMSLWMINLTNVGVLYTSQKQK